MKILISTILSGIVFIAIYTQAAVLLLIQCWPCKEMPTKEDVMDFAIVWVCIILLAKTIKDNLWKE